VLAPADVLLEEAQATRDAKVAAVLNRGDYIPARLVMDLLLDCFYEQTKGQPVHDEVLALLTLSTRRMTFKSDDIYQRLILPTSGL
jgi:hypothetical protein